MSTISSERVHADAVRGLYDGLVRFNRSMRRQLGDWGHLTGDLSRGDIVTLGAIAGAGRTRPGQIAATLCVDPSVVSRNLATLHALGLVERGVDPSDRRAELVAITVSGRRRLRAASEATWQALAACLTTWEPDAIARAAAVLDDIAAALQDGPGKTRQKTPENTAENTPVAPTTHPVSTTATS